ncbi:peptide deformylase [Kitasatospora sp. NPDC059577]|uniref:peptide deformylase n=1 Tax=Kitasatospora sp. NPDC059577 TaxID=3346873 RepID=UPI0036B29A69
MTAASGETDEKYDGCLSFFDVRGLVPRPLRISVTATSLDGTITTVTYEFGLARLIAHEIDRLDGLLYTARMRPDIHPIPVEEYRGTGSTWTC